jgi:glycosyltransferase involved in cell wall biosynthesis
MKPTVSVIIPTYKRPALLIRCLQALAMQQFPKKQFEIIVVTDGPDIITRAAIQQQHFTTPLVRVFSLPVKKGPAAARNFGWEKATGNLILFTDDDCVPHTSWIKEFYTAYTQQPFASAAFTGRVIVPRSNKPTDYEKNTAWLEQADFVTANCACTKTALKQINGFDETYTMAWREDSDLEFKLIGQKVPIHFVQQAIVTHPVRKAPWGISLKEQKKSMFNALLYKKYPGLYRQKIHKRPLWNYYAIVLLFIAIIISAAMQLSAIAIIAFLAWLLFVSQFIIKRLRGTTHAAGHVAEMIITSIVIPFLSIFWTLYGSLKFKTLLI